MNDTAAADMFYVSPPIDPLIFTVSGVIMITIGAFGMFANLVFFHYYKYLIESYLFLPSCEL
jgi:hypothetical protein